MQLMSEIHDAVVIGGGQAALVASHALAERGLDHVVLERDRVAERWRTARWDSLRFQFPNTVLGLPGMPYDGPDPDGFAHHLEVVGWLERYRRLVGAPVREQTPVTSLDRHADGWRVATPEGELLAGAVVVTTGPFQRARIPQLSADLPDDLVQLHSVEYHNPDVLPDGAVLVVGSGASGAQIAEELAGMGRPTYLCVSRHRRVPRRCLGHDITRWLITLGLMDRTRVDWVDGRMPPTVLVTGVDGGHDLNLRALGAQGVSLLGTLRGAAGGVLQLADDAELILAAADNMHDEVVRMIGHHAGNLGHDLPEQDPARLTASPVPYRPTVSLRDAGITSVIWATGYSFDYDWLHAPCLDARGEPVQQRGVADVEGLYFLGLHWMHAFKSGTFLGIGDDAAHVADHLAAHVRGR
jgi:putative flavoprotein involved in K+ transport